MQNAKDTFYEMLRGRVAAGNPARTVVLRGVVRPGLVADENEIASAAELRDCFHLDWAALQVNDDGPAPLVTMQCEVLYATAGSADAGGMDRGRALAAMDGELLVAVGTAPQSAVKNNYAALASGGAAVPMSSNIWWGDVVFGELKAEEGELRRSATVEVWSYQEAGEV